MRLFMKFIGLLIIIGVIFLLAVILWPAHRTPPSEVLGPDYKPEKGQGEYLAKLGDCAACHTKPGQAKYSGGYEVASPFGTIYASNITPDKETGIGNWTLDQFRGALLDGISNDGHRLYPAMPYENFRGLSEKDVVALYDYFMNDVPAVNNKVTPTDLSFPFNQRWGIRLWDWLASSSQASFKPRFNDAKLDRGAYIVETLEHCGACHTPRNVFYMQSATNNTSDKFLRGETVDGWFAPDLRGPNSSLKRWEVADIKSYLQTARNQYSAAVGPMGLAVHDSLQFATDDDLNAVAAYLKHIALPGEAPKPVRDASKTTAMLTEAKPDMELGALLYLNNCNACHFANGKGAPNVFPQLDGAQIVNAEDPSGMLRVIMGGSRMPSTATRPEPLAMPGFAWRLSDDEAAALATFIRQAWSNNAKAVTAKDAANARARVASGKE